MPGPLTRRDFLKVSSLSLSALAFQRWLPPEDRVPPLGTARVTYSRIHIYDGPSFGAERLRWKGRDELLPIFEEVRSPHGPAHNPLWYRVVDGYAHSGYLQRVETRLNAPPAGIPEAGQIGEVTVPFTQSWRFTRSAGWTPLYRLYYGSHHWVTAVDTGPDGEPWSRITDERLRVHYSVPAAHLRLVPAEEVTPLSPHVPAEKKRIRVSLQDQTLTAYEDDRAVFQATVATGLPSRGPTPNGIPTDTPTGRFLISRKMPVRHMGDGFLTSDPGAYELPGVPWCCFFVSTGVAFHGTYWHNNFGRPMSHGCVNMRDQDAKWLFRWAAPVSGPDEWFTAGRGTVVDVV